MKKCLFSSLAALLAAFTASGAVEPLAVLRIPSVEKLGSATTQLCGAVGQPMMGGMAMGMLQQYIQTAIGPFDTTKPLAVVAYADTAKLEASLSSPDAANPMKGLSDTAAGLILPITMSGEDFARSKLLKLNAEGVAQLPGTPMFITFKGTNAYIASDAQTALRLKAETARYHTAPAHGDALSLEFSQPAIALYGNLLEKQSKNDAAAKDAVYQKLALSSVMQSQQLLSQLSSFTLGLGYGQARGLVIGTNTRFKPGSELAAAAAAATPVKAGLLANVPDAAQFCQLVSTHSPSMTAHFNSSPDVKTLLDMSIGKKFPALSQAFADSVSTFQQLLPRCDQYLVTAGFDKAAKLWGYSRVTTAAGARDAVFQSVTEANRKLVSAVAAAFPGKKFLSYDAGSATIVFDFAQLPLREIVEAVQDGKKIKEKDFAELEKTVQALNRALTGGKTLRTRFTKTADGYETVTSCDGVANIPKSGGNGKMASKAVANASQFLSFDLFTMAKNVLEELAPQLPEEGKKKLSPIAAAIPAGGPDSAITQNEKIEGGVSRNEVVLPPGALQKGAALFAVFSAKGDEDDDQ